MKSYIYALVLVSSVALSVTSSAHADTVSGGGYIINQIIAPIQGALSGNGYILHSGSQVNTDMTSGGGYSIYSSFGAETPTSTTSTSTPPPTPPTTTYVTNNGGGFYVLPPTIPQKPTGTTTATTTYPDTIITPNGSSCSTRVVFSAPIDIGLKNNPADVKKLETFLNSYEGEHLKVNGIYEKADIDAVKRWQKKYKSFILDPMRLKNPTGTIYTLSMRQIERQTTRYCGEPVVITACPFFKTNVSYGDRGEAVLRVQQFLNIVQGEKLPLSGVFGPLTQSAVKRFQKARKIYVATFIPISWATGNWYTTTRIKANETIGCDILR